MKTKSENPPSVESLSWQQLSPEMVFWVVCQNSTPSNPDFGEVWQFRVEEILPRKEVAKVSVVFPAGLEEVAFFDEVKIGETLQVYLDPRKNGYFVDWDVIDILLWS